MNSRTTENDSNAAFLAGGGEMGALMRAKDWSKTPVGPVEMWPQSLRTTVQIMLGSRYAMWMGWGRERTFFYNDAYRPTLGTKHPWALGASATEVWAEIWSAIGPRIESVEQRGEGTWDEGLLLFLERHGYPEETYHTFSYSPLPDDAGGIGGMFCVVTEETDRIIGERRLRVLREVAAAIAATRTPDEVLTAVGSQLAKDRHDLPFSLIYLWDSDDGTARLASTTGLTAGHEAAPATIDAADAAAPWPIGSVLAQHPTMIDDLAIKFAALPADPWDKPPRQAIALPIAQQGQSRPAGVFIAGLNPYRPFKEEYRGFIGLLVGQIAAGLANAVAYEKERQRAEALAEINRAKTTFFSNASHEFRTPLTLMLSPLEDMLVRAPTAEIVRVTRREVELIHRNGLRLLKLVNTLLDFSRIEAGRVQSIFEPVDLAAYTAELASTFRSAMDKAGLRYVVDCKPLPTEIYVDRDMWEKIVLNLVSNAFKYTLQGEVAVALEMTPDGRAVALTVRDTGEGIPPHEVPRLFERFHRVEGQRGRTQEGTGIGLALVQELAKIHGGSVAVESELDRGTTFTVTIPLGKAHLPAERIGAARDAASTGLRAVAFVEEALRWLPGEGLGQETTIEKELLGSELTPTATPGERSFVLLADDNADMRDYVRRLLAPRYEVEAVADGKAALESALRRRPDLVLSDIMMPRLDGFGLLQALRADPGLRDVPIILLSARAGDEAKIEGLEIGADDYLVKPFSARELLARVGANLAMARVRREAEEALRDLNQTLKQRVATEIEARMKVEEALRQAQKMEAVGQLTGGIAHDFNNLLTVIQGNLETIERRLENPSAQLKRAIAAGLRGAERAATLTQRLLAFSRRQPLDPRSLDPNKLVAGMSDLLRRTLGEAVAIESVLAGGLWWISADSNQLESALLNLAVNARDAMPGGGKLTIETANAFLDESYAAAHEEVNPGQYVMLAVSDTGTGMPKSVVERAFEPFFTTKGVGQGTGLGLSQVYGFVKQSGGHVKLYSEVGQGTTVKLYLPRLTGNEAMIAGTDAIEPPAIEGRSETILLVEDDADVRRHGVAILRELGYRVLEAADGPTALRIIGDGPPIDLLFTDVGLPGGLTGRQLADEARRRHAGLKVLFTTGYARNAIVHQGRLDPGVELIVKPFTYGGLATKIRQIIDGDR